MHPHTNVDHREIGPSARMLVSNTWVAIAEFTAKPDRQSAVVSAVETRIELFREDHHVASSFLIASRDGHRVVALIWVEGHDEFNALRSAWDQHEQHLARTDKEETVKLTLCRCVSTSGDPTFAVQSSDIVTFDAFETGAKPASDVVGTGDATVLGTALLRDDSSTHSFFLTRRSRIADRSARRYHVFRSWDKS